MDTEITFLFMDYETFNRNPKGGRATQFASIRTNYHLNIISSSALNLFCEQSNDNIPSPQAALITKITPQKIIRIKKGEEKVPESSFTVTPEVYNEYFFIKRINTEMSVPSTCTLGYNSFKFDDEFTRNLLYRNLLDPYTREWQNNNSRFDVYYLVIATYILKPNLLIFPNAVAKETNEPLFHSKTKLPLPSFRLEELSASNGINHINAHDAFSDVEATIALMKKIKEGDDYFFEEMFAFRKKSHVAMWLSNKISTPFIHISQYYGKENYCFGVLFQINSIKDKTLCLNLAYDVTPLLSLEGEKLQDYLFPQDKKLTPKIVVTLSHNQCPLLASVSEYKERLNLFQLDMLLLRRNLDLIKENLILLKSKLSPIFFKPYTSPVESIDSDLAIYNGFFSPQERSQQSLIHDSISSNQLMDFDYSTFTPRIQEMTFKLKARNFPKSLTQDEKEKWFTYSKNRLLINDSGAELTMKDFFDELEISRKTSLNPIDISILDELEEYVNRLKELFSI